MHTYIVLKQGRDDSTLSSLRAYIQPEYTHNQNGSTHLLLRHPILHLNITSSRYTSKCMYTSTSCAVGFERIFTCTCESFFRNTCVYVMAFF